jgi:hypothetical protein
VAVLVATLVVAGLLAGACGSGRESGRGVVASRPAGTQAIGPLTVLTLADHRVPALASLLAPADRVVVRQRIPFTDGDDAVTACSTEDEPTSSSRAATSTPRTWRAPAFCSLSTRSACPA